MTNPPKLAVRLFRWFCKDAMVEDMLGDLDEIFDNNLSKMPVWKAKLHYWVQVIDLITSYSVRKRKNDSSFHVLSITQNNTAMFKNYLKVALRSLSKQKLFTVINIIGLSAGMSIGLLFITLIAFVQTYDNFHENRANIYRIISNTDDKVKTKRLASTPAPLAEIIEEQHSGFGEVIRINKSLKAEAKYDNKELPLSGYFADKNFFNVFSFELLTGDKSMNDPYGIYITKSYAEKLFSEKNPLGEVIQLGKLGDFTVRGVVADIPKNSHMWFEAIVPYEALAKLASSGKVEANLNEWEDYRGNYTYLLLPSDAKTDLLTASLNTIAKEKYKNIDQFNATFKVQRMDDIPLGSDTSDEIGTAWGTEIYLMGLSLTLLILLPACFNYANISTAKALSRAKEIGMRKVVGGIKKQIFLQFILETVVVSLISLAGAYVIFSLIRSEFQSMLVVGSTSLNFDITPINLLYGILFAILTGILAGIFPAIHFSKIKPIAALKKTAKSQVLGKVNMQKTLLVIQFTLSFGFIMGIVVFIDQYRTAINYDLGFNQENILDIELQGVEPENLRASLDKLASIEAVSMSSHILGVNSNAQIWLPHLDDSTEVTQMFIDHNYMNNLDLNFVAGETFEPLNSSNEQFVIVNEKFTNLKGFDSPEMAVGEAVSINDSTQLRIAGVVENFHFQNLSRKIQPIIFRYNDEHFKYANVKVVSNDIAGTIIDIEEEWKKLSPMKMEAKFFSAEIDEAFDIYSNVVKIFFFLGFLAITISCLGLLSMVVFSTENRTKEVGIRKVMGAPVVNVTYLLTKDFLKLMMIGSAISIPISYMLFTVIISQQNAYSTGIGVLPVIISLAILLLLGLITVISQTWKVANSNPTETLRYE
ncbi:ABC transporter permease [Fulvivirga sp. RKSG066]|uniref:ABC transporter permease n=1 Tax=Fulvivirga aurantia TaxID=2529383 RepID=UPI0012BBE507|nr:ABC transporter permease [Fulvivirga aurantia]MTI22946.1 ABC transporter permease [Fulvivirga aurantia]